MHLKINVLPVSKKLTALLVCPLCLGACQQMAMQGYTGARPSVGTTVTPEVTQIAPIPRFSVEQSMVNEDYIGLKAWWSFFNDSVLNSLISSALSMNAAELEKKERLSESNMTRGSLEDYYRNNRADLVSAITGDYIEYRYVQMQDNLLDQYMEQMEVENEGRQTKSETEFLLKRKEEFVSKLKELSVSLSKTTRLLPEYIDEVLKNNQGIPGYDITPIMASSAHTITHASRIDAARSMLSYETQGQIGIRETGNILLDIPLNQLFGISENVFVNPQSSWRVKIGSARDQASFDHLHTLSGHRQQIEDFEDEVHSYIAEIETVLVSIATLRDQQQVLEKAASNAMQDETYKARLAALRAKYEKTRTIIKLFDLLDLY